MRSDRASGTINRRHMLSHGTRDHWFQLRDMESGVKARVLWQLYTRYLIYLLYYLERPQVVRRQFSVARETSEVPGRNPHTGGTAVSRCDAGHHQYLLLGCLEVSVV